MSMIQQTLTKMRSLKLAGMAQSYASQLDQPTRHELPFDDRLGMLIDSELTARENRRLKRLIKSAGLIEAAAIEDLDTRAVRGLDKALIAALSTCDWVRRQQNLILIGATGLGKSWLASAFGMQACRLGMAVVYRRTVDLYAELATAIADGSLPKTKAQLIKAAVLIIDDLGLGEVSPAVGHALLDVIDRRLRTGSLILTSQFPIDHWHNFFPDPTLADAILDRIVHQAHRIELKGESLRKVYAKKRFESEAGR